MIWERGVELYRDSFSRYCPSCDGLLTRRVEDHFVGDQPVTFDWTRCDGCDLAKGEAPPPKPKAAAPRQAGLLLLLALLAGCATSPELKKSGAIAKGLQIDSIMAVCPRATRVVSAVVGRNELLTQIGRVCGSTGRL